jgi:NTP pyrophosphatase (non-canonical NTP hydrolase)
MEVIDIKERVPQAEYGSFLVYAPQSFPKNSRWVVAEWYDDVKCFYSESSEKFMPDVTHWMDERDYKAMNKDMKSENIFKEAVDHFGVENQLLKLVEEMAELTQAIIKRKLNPDEPKYLNNMLEEFADVNIVMNQVAHSDLFESEIADDLFAMHYKRKLDRLESLLKTSEKTKGQN